MTFTKGKLQGEVERGKVWISVERRTMTSCGEGELLCVEDGRSVDVRGGRGFEERKRAPV